MTFDHIYGVDFSGAKRAGKNTWIARLEPHTTRPFKLALLKSLEALCGTSEREAALGWLVESIAASERALWALDFCFGFPLEVAGCRQTQFELLETWAHDDYGLGVMLTERTLGLHGKRHVQRLTDLEAKAPLDPYHYRLIYQTFHGMRSVLGPLEGLPRTAVLPFQYRKLPRAKRVIVEACPSSTLQRLGLPHQNYKQPGSKTVDARRRAARRNILAYLETLVQFSGRQRTLMLRDPGADALDALIAAVGAAQAWEQTDHRAVARHPRYRLEGRKFV